MSFGNAVSQREAMITEYERMLKDETNADRIADIQDKILQTQDEISELKKGKPIFGRAKPLRQTTTIIEPDREHPGQQKVTVVNPTPNSTPTTNLKTSKTNTRLENSLRAKIQAAKAAKQTT